jgi:hypothetical protein
MNTWADRVYEIVDRDLSAQAWADLKPLGTLVAGTSVAAASPFTASSSPSGPFPKAIAVDSPTAGVPPAEPPATAKLVVNARLVFKSKPIHRKQLLPYQEFLVGLIYDVKEVIAGEYSDKQVLVMHPAYIGLRRQPLSKYHVGRTYKLELRELEGSIWNTVKSKDDSGRIDLQPYIRIQDEARYPENAR